VHIFQLRQRTSGSSDNSARAGDVGGGIALLGSAGISAEADVIEVQLMRLT
jgi:hypothetical protein